MSPGSTPLCARRNGKNVIQFQSYNGSSPANGQTDDLCAVGTPSEVPKPFLMTRVEKSNAPTCQWIIGVGLAAFEAIA